MPAEELKLPQTSAVTQPVMDASGPRSIEPRVLQSDFFARPALAVAKELLGKCLVRRSTGRETAAIITETEAYVGPHDLACHASKGRTARTEVMFGPAGCWYVYFVYGMHWMLNAVTDGEGYPSAVLIRGAGPWNGPAKLTKALAIDKTSNTRPIAPAAGLWIEDRLFKLPRSRVRRTPRIGVDFSGDWAKKAYRFVIAPPIAPEMETAWVKNCQRPGGRSIPLAPGRMDPWQ